MDSFFEQFSQILEQGLLRTDETVQARLEEISKATSAFEVVKDSDSLPFSIDLVWLVPPPSRGEGVLANPTNDTIVQPESKKIPIEEKQNIDEPVVTRPVSRVEIPAQKGVWAEKPISSKLTGQVADVVREVAPVSDDLGSVPGASSPIIPKDEDVVSEPLALDNLDALKIKPQQDFEKRVREREEKLGDRFKRDRGGTV